MENLKCIQRNIEPRKELEFDDMLRDLNRQHKLANTEREEIDKEINIER